MPCARNDKTKDASALLVMILLLISMIAACSQPAALAQEGNLQEAQPQAVAAPAAPAPGPHIDSVAPGAPCLAAGRVAQARACFWR